MLVHDRKESNIKKNKIKMIECFVFSINKITQIYLGKPKINMNQLIFLLRK